jgi:hypothetical protein
VTDFRNVIVAHYLLKCPCELSHIEKEKSMYHFINFRSSSYYHQLVLVVNLLWVYKWTNSSPPCLGCLDPFSKFYQFSQMLASQKELMQTETGKSFLRFYISYIICFFTLSNVRIQSLISLIIHNKKL